MQEKRTEIRVAWPGFRRNQGGGRVKPCLIEVPVDPVRSIVIRIRLSALCGPQESGNYPERMPGPLTNSKIALTHDHRGL
jgi:hypothetical protein